MYQPTTVLFGRSWSTYTVLLMIGILASIGWMLLRAEKGGRRATLDACLLALVGGVVIGRLGHVLLNWAYFHDHTQEITRMYFQGGLSVQGALLGAGLGLWIAAHWRRFSLSHLLDSATLTIPLLALMSWWGCATNACAYGAPVEQMTAYPPLLTWVAPDIYGIVEPRFATQRLGMIFALFLLLLTALLFWRGWLTGKRLWITIILLCLGNLTLDATRPNYASLLENPDAEALLYTLFILISAGMLVRTSRTRTES